ncbi:hypothetical protein JNM05_03365 [bacterium]|nr:hypothetical protein [bacterium]
MRVREIELLIKSFRWNTLQKMYGCAHSSIIGFISTEWINMSTENSVLDGVPSPQIGKGRKGQRNADLLLCKNNTPYIPVEVETQVSKYNEKFETLRHYIENKENFNGIAFGFLFMTNLCSGNMKYKHNWDPIKKKVKEEEKAIVLVSIEKVKNSSKNKSSLDLLRDRNDYNPWDIVKIDYWLYQNKEIREGSLLPRQD